MVDWQLISAMLLSSILAMYEVLFLIFSGRNNIHIIVLLFLIAIYYCTSHSVCIQTKLYSLSKTIVKVVPLWLLLMGDTFKLFFCLNTTLLITVMLLTVFHLPQKFDINSTVFCIPLAIQEIFQMLTCVTSVSQGNCTYFSAPQGRTFFLSVISSTNAEVCCFCFTFKRED